jgi:hypothetical protein
MKHRLLALLAIHWSEVLIRFPRRALTCNSEHDRGRLKYVRNDSATQLSIFLMKGRVTVTSLVSPEST